MYSDNNKGAEGIFRLLSSRLPDAAAVVNGSKKYPSIRGSVSFYKTSGGTLVLSEIDRLPCNPEKCKQSIFAMHIHNGNCTDDGVIPFPNADGHYNPNGCRHPYHAGDLPPLFCSNGYALSMFLTDRFNLDEVLGRSVIIHANPDDFTTQPSGNSGEMIACGSIRPLKR